MRYPRSLSTGMRAGEPRGIIDLAAAEAGGDAKVNTRQARPPSPCAYPPYVKGADNHAACTSSSIAAAAAPGNPPAVGAGAVSYTHLTLPTILLV